MEIRCYLIKATSLTEIRKEEIHDTIDKTISSPAVKPASGVMDGSPTLSTKIVVSLLVDR